MKKLLFFLLFIPFVAYGQPNEWTVGMTPLQARAGLNANDAAIYDSLESHYDAIALNYGGILSLNDSVDSLRVAISAGGTGDLAFEDTVYATGFLQTNYRSDTAIANLREEIEEISTGTGFLEAADTAAMLTPYARFGEVSNLISDSLQAIAEAAEEGVLLADSSGFAAGSYVTGYDFVQGQLLNAQLADVRPLFVFGSGVGLVADSALFQVASDYGGFFNKGTDSLVVTSINCLMLNGAGNDTLSIAVQWHATYNSGSATLLNTTALPIGRPNGLTTGTEDTSFNNSVIPPNVWVWMETPYVLAGNKPYGLRVTLSGYRK